jgi:hypothetical protein
MLEARLNRANWVVKGGVNLRAWFGSRRYSEGLDLDVIKCAHDVLRERFDKVLLSRPLAEVLTTQGLEITRISRPKRTDTPGRHPRRRVLDRYLEILGKRVDGLGGVSSRIPPSPYGAPPDVSGPGCLVRWLYVVRDLLRRLLPEA